MTAQLPFDRRIGTRRDVRRPPRAAGALLLFLVLLVARPAAATEGPSLAEVVARAAERSPARPVVDATSREAAALSRRASSWLADVPALSFSHRTDAVGSDDGLQESILGLSLPIWLPGRRSARGRIATAADVEARSCGSSLDWEVAGEVREAVWAAAIARSELARTERVAANALELEHRVGRRSQAGELARSDTVLAREETWRRRTDVLRAKSALAQALGAYEELTGLAILPAEFRERRPAVPPDEEEHPRLRATRARWSRAEAEMDAVRRERGGAPAVLVGGQRQRDARGTPFNESMIFGVSVPLGLSAQVAPEIARLARAAAEAEREHRAAVREVRLSIRSAEIRLAETEAVLSASRSGADLARESERMADRAFELGESDLVTLLLVRDRAIAAAAAAEMRGLERDREIARYNQVLGIVPR